MLKFFGTKWEQKCSFKTHFSMIKPNRCQYRLAPVNLINSVFMRFLRLSIPITRSKIKIRSRKRTDFILYYGNTVKYLVSSDLLPSAKK